MKIAGGCYCGAVRYEAEGEPLMKAQCHCRQCQYFTGGAVNVFMAMPEAGFRYTKGSAKAYHRTDLDIPVTREFCPECGVHVISRRPGFPAAILKVGTMDDPAQFGMPNVAIHTLESWPHHHVPEGVMAFERLPPRR